MKCSQLAGLILTGFALGLGGCNNAEEEAPHSVAEQETPVGKLGRGATPGPVEPAPGPHLPYPGSPEAKELKDAKDAAKVSEAKPADKPAEAKP